MNNTLPRFATISHFTHTVGTHPPMVETFQENQTSLLFHVVNLCEAPTVPAMLKPTSSIPARNLADEIWEIQHIATFLQIRSSAAKLDD